MAKVTADVFGDRFTVTVTYDARAREARAHVTLMDWPAHTAVLRANREWFQLGIPELDVGAFMLDYDEDERYKEALVRRLATVGLAYLEGRGRVEWRRGVLRTRPVLCIEVDGQAWELEHRTSRSHYPDEDW